MRLDGAQTDTALLSQTDRFGREATIRQELAAADLAFRQTNRGLPVEQLANVNVYYRAYERQTLDRYAELERLRRLGIRTPAVPPEISDN